jgi:hypothetical protein
VFPILFGAASCALECVVTLDGNAAEIVRAEA